MSAEPTFHPGQIVLAQLGSARRIKLMTGAKHFVLTDAGVNIGLPGSKCVRITLDPSDTYTVETLRFARSRDVLRGKPLFSILHTASGVHVEQLAETFTAQTGLELSL